MSEHIAPSTRLISYNADGEALEFFFPFIVWDKNGIDVFINDVLQEKDTYELRGLGEFAGGSVIFKPAPEKDGVVSIAGNTTRERAVDYNQYVSLTASSMNLDANYQEAQIQENTTSIKRALLAAVSDGVPDSSLMLPSLEDRKNSYLGFDEEGAPIALGSASNVVSGLQGTGSTPHGVMIWSDASGLQSADSKRVFGEPNGAATLDSTGVVPDAQLPERGHAITSDGKAREYRKILNLSDEFVVSNDDTSTNVRLGLVINTLGTGMPTVKNYDGHGVFNTHSLLAGPNVGIKEQEDGTLVISAAASTEKRYVYTFTADTWTDDLQIIIPPELHGLGEQGDLLAAVRDDAGNQVFCDVNVSSLGVVTITTDVRFGGSLIIYGAVTWNEVLLVNPMVSSGDIIIGGSNGQPVRLPIGEYEQVICVQNDGMPGYRTLGTAAWKDINQPSGLPVLDDNNELPVEFLPYSTMTYKGTFGSAASSTGGDLPASDVLDGDVYCEYFSSVAEISFNIGDQALFDGTNWVKISSSGMINPMITQGDIIIGGVNGAPERLACPISEGQYSLCSTITSSGTAITWQQAK